MLNIESLKQSFKLTDSGIKLRKVLERIISSLNFYSVRKKRYIMSNNKCFCSVNCPYFLLGIDISRCILYHTEVIRYKDCLKYTLNGNKETF